ncbi:hypothetical protein T01_12013 [Trichinella spiralis]|uniref:Uncharacterized protein n=1 Tax=Trichinella spiralis TaxID=6334 RepID=A0A0V1AVH6_TRISP|nr:hypothetical protein T01_12013 [Trichinella spiralis]
MQKLRIAFGQFKRANFKDMTYCVECENENAMKHCSSPHMAQLATRKSHGLDQASRKLCSEGDVRSVLVCSKGVARKIFTYDTHRYYNRKIFLTFEMSYVSCKHLFFA